MHNTTRYLLIILSFLCIFISCKENNERSYIAAFSIQGQSDSARIDTLSRTVYYKMPADVKSGKGLVPVFSLSGKGKIYADGEEQVSGVTQVNFERPVEYTIVSKNKKDTAKWKIVITNNDTTYKWGMGRFLSQAKSNDSTRPGGWYVTQKRTGKFASTNCGPACAIMAAKWSDAAFSKNVEDARNSCTRNKYWYLENIWNYLKANHIPYTVDFRKENNRETFFDDIKKHIDENKIVVVGLNMKYISRIFGPAKNYMQEGGHFVIVKGYWIVDDKTYLEIYDPEAWQVGNSYYKAEEVYQGVLNHGNILLIVSQK